MMAEFPQPSALLRQMNSRNLMKLIIHRGPVTRVDLARRSGLSKQTVSEIVRELETAGWVRETGRVHGRVGRSALAYELNPRAAFAIGVDLGGTNLRAAISDLGGALLREVTVPTDARGGRDVLGQIHDTCRQLARRVNAGWQRVQCVAVGLPGVFNPQTGRMDLAVNLPSLGDLRVKDHLQAALGVPVLLDNDVNMAVLGEHWQGLGQDATDFVFIAIGTGIGMGLVVDDEIRRGARGAAGEIGYLPIGTDPLDPANQVKGPFEEAAGGAGIIRRYQEAGGAEGTTVQEVFAAAAAGDPVAVHAVDDEGRLIAQAVTSVASVLDPELVVLGGGIGSRAELLEPVQRWLGRFMRTPVEVRTSQLGHRASLVGALSVALRHAHETLFGAAGAEAPLSLPVPPRSIAREA